ncbi:unnamed protein product [Echinostoma caproni]|uniref:UDP-N-acetylglucosamine transferase subunit ALG13 n=1 Tax=Echinostoma caproni TaxID=27848 RepID=A0A183B9Y4_9TREM|nr:unnamed protein product [Echinostoma caproni]
MKLPRAPRVLANPNVVVIGGILEHLMLVNETQVESNNAATGQPIFSPGPTSIGSLDFGQQNTLINPKEPSHTMATVFVTVGTTQFDDLVVEVNKPSFHIALWLIGYRKLIVQYGNGTIIPESPSAESIKEVFERLKCHGTKRDIQPLVLEAFRFKSDLESEFLAASLVISHGGAGTCLRALTPGGERRLIVVINETLMGNHQEELASALSEGRHALATTPSKLIGFLLQDSEAIQIPSQVSNHIIRVNFPTDTFYEMSHRFH